MAGGGGGECLERSLDLETLSVISRPERERVSIYYIASFHKMSFLILKLTCKDIHPLTVSLDEWKST